VFGVIVLTLLILLALTAIGTILVFAWIDDTAAIYVRDVAPLACTLTYYRLRELQPASFRSRTRDTTWLCAAPSRCSGSHSSSPPLALVDQKDPGEVVKPGFSATASP
jgi:hypothetical protein